jgi:hypothetical protein
MSQHEAGDSHLPKWLDNTMPADDDLEIVRLSAARTRAMDEAGAAIARQLNGPLTALLLYMGEIKQHRVLAGLGRSCLPATGGGKRASADRARLRDDEADRGQS